MLYLNIGENLEITGDVAHERMAFWDGVYNRYCRPSSEVATVTSSKTVDY